MSRLVSAVPRHADKWDGKVWNLQVTDAGESTVELRALMSSADSGSSWDLRCLVREKLVEFLQKNYTDSLPRIRAEVRSPDEAGDIPQLPARRS